VILQRFVDISKLKRHHLTHLLIASRWLRSPDIRLGVCVSFLRRKGREIISWVGGNHCGCSLMFCVCEIVVDLGTHSRVASSHQVRVQPNCFLFGTLIW
jgi:hypothetical protein